MTDTEYTNFTSELATKIRAMDGTDIIIPELVGQLVPGHAANAAVRRALPHGLRNRYDTAMEKAARDMEQAQAEEERRNRVASVLGSYPRIPSELVAAYAERHQLHVTGDGTVIQQAPERRVTDLDKVCRDIRLINADLQLRLSDHALNDGVFAWHDREVEAAVARLCQQLAYDAACTTALNQFQQIVETAFDTGTMPADMITALFKKHIWQVKRRLLDMPVTQHLMVVVGGEQEVGKSTLVNMFLSPLGDMVREGDFEQLTDQRNIDLFRAATIFFDEMPSASKSDINAVKHIITASTVSRRPMRTNRSINVPQRATFIGTTNLPLNSILRDETGMRRFAEVLMVRPAHNSINATDWTALWRAVNPEAEDPALPYKGLLVAQQAELRDKTTTEEWFAQYDHEAVSSGCRDKFIAAHLAYEDFRQFEDARFPRHKTDIRVWGRQMTPLVRQGKVTRDQRDDGTYYRFGKQPTVMAAWRTRRS